MMVTHHSLAPLATGGLVVRDSLNSSDKMILKQWSIFRGIRDLMFLSDILTVLMLAVRYWMQVCNSSLYD
jgi:hypothetical protein